MTRPKNHLAVNGTKMCLRCEKTKKVEEFYKNSIKEDGLSPHCMECNSRPHHRKYEKTYYGIKKEREKKEVSSVINDWERTMAIAFLLRI